MWWDSHTRLFVWQAQRGIACRCLSACLPRESRLARACVRARTHAESPPGRACWLLGTHVAVDDSDPVLASPRRWVMRSSFTTVLVFFSHPALLRRSDHRPAGQGRGSEEEETMRCCIRAEEFRGRSLLSSLSLLDRGERRGSREGARRHQPTSVGLLLVQGTVGSV